MTHRTTPADLEFTSPRLEVRQSVELFPTGKWNITPAAISLLAHHHVDPAGIIWRHRAGDWGDVDLDQAMANNNAVLFGGPILSRYRVSREHSGQNVRSEIAEPAIHVAVGRDLVSVETFRCRSVHGHLRD